MEELPVGQFILRVQATDSDQPDEPNSLVSYDITNVIATVSVGTLSPVSVGLSLSQCKVGYRNQFFSQYSIQVYSTGLITM